MADPANKPGPSYYRPRVPPGPPDVLPIPQYSSTQQQIPSPSRGHKDDADRTRRRERVSEMQQVPTFPTVNWNSKRDRPRREAGYPPRIVLEPEYEYRSEHRERSRERSRSDRKQIPSPPKRTTSGATSRQVPPPSRPSRPTPPEFSRSADDVRNPRTPRPSNPVPRDGLLSPPDETLRPSPTGRPAAGLKRSNSDRAPNPRGIPFAHAVRQSWSSNAGASAVPSESTSKVSLASSPSGMLGDQAYQYQPLQDSHIRLVRLFPETKTRIKCQIIHASLEQPPPYVAISYAWGDAGDTRKIELEGSLIPIAVSLYGALEALRQKTEFVLVWADALCIDQQNKDERTQQVEAMTGIYSTAESVAVWLGPEEDDSELALKLLRNVADQVDSSERVSQLISSRDRQADLAAVVSLFERDYWERLWVVQEVSNARSITVHCGSSRIPWTVYELAAHAFARHRGDLDLRFPGNRRHSRRVVTSAAQFSYAQVLAGQGPNSFPDLRSYMSHGPESLLEVLRVCRRKLTSDARDKLYGILGVLPENVRNEFRANYNLSIKDVYTEIVDYLLKTTESTDVICDAIHFPVHTGTANLPSYIPDWSHVPQTAAIGHKYSFSAAGTTKAMCRFRDDRLNKLEVSAVELGTITTHGIAVGTLCTLADYLMAFLHWRALLLASLEDKDEEYSLRAQANFCKTLSLGQVPRPWDDADSWLTVCYHVFAYLLSERLPHLPLDRKLREYADKNVSIGPAPRREFLQKHFGDMMMGRCFCLTSESHIGMGTGYMLPGDTIVVPLGCSTPVLLRMEGTRGEYRFVGDVYIHGYMNGKAIDSWKSGRRKLKKFVLH